MDTYATLGGDGFPPGDDSLSVLIVDDDEFVRALLVRLLTDDGFRCTTATGGDEARARLREDRFAVALVDVLMPGESGLDLVGDIHAADPDAAVVMVTGVDDPRIARQVLDDGAYGYVVKPFRPNEVLISVANARRRRALEMESRANREQLEQRVSERTANLTLALEQLQHAEEDVRQASEVTVGILARAIEHRDEETSAHVERMSHYAELIAGGLGLGEQRCALIRMAAPMHDIGKIAVPDGILFKPGRLSAAEYDVIKTHAERGGEILGKSDAELLITASVIARTHHERWDGNGYPEGLVGEEIPIEGRIAAVADVFDALVSRRVYKPAWPFEEAVDYIRHGLGSQFDPAATRVFLDSLDEVAEIRRHYADA